MALQLLCILLTVPLSCCTAGCVGRYGGTPPAGCDAFHDLIVVDEISRCASGGLLWSVFFTFSIALPPVLNEGSASLKEEVARDVITGKKIMSLAVTEPYAGSDVAGLTTTAVKDPTGEFYIVNGLKKFITGGTRASYFTTAVRTGGKGFGGVSVLVIPAHLEGVKCTRMKMQGECFSCSWKCATAAAMTCVIRGAGLNWVFPAACNICVCVRVCVQVGG